MCDWGGMGNSSFPSSLILRPVPFPHLSHTHRHSHTSHLLATITTTITTGTQQKAMMQLTSCASPAILGVTANISQDGSSVQALTPQGIRQGLCPPPGTVFVPLLAQAKRPHWQCRWHQGLSGKKGVKVGEGRSFLFIFF